MVETQEEFDRRWNTCRHCGITKEKIEEEKKKGEYTFNSVWDGECRVCRDKIKDKSDFEKASKEGKITRDDSIMCPYCGEVEEDDLGEYHNEDSFNCPECNRESKLSIEYTSHFTTTKKHGVK